MAKDKDLNKSSTNIRDMGRGFLGMPKARERAISRGIGLGLVVFGGYLLLVYLKIIPYSPRLANFLDSKGQILFTSITSIIVGVLFNDKLRNIFRK